MKKLLFIICISLVGFVRPISLVAQDNQDAFDPPNEEANSYSSIGAYPNSSREEAFSEIEASSLNKNEMPDISLTIACEDQKSTQEIGEDERDTPLLLMAIGPLTY